MNVTYDLDHAKDDAIAPYKHHSPFLRKVSVTTFLLASLATAALLGLVPAHGANHVLTFDDLGVPVGGRVTVNTQYAAQGVTFNNVSAIDYSTRGLPTRAGSGSSSVSPSSSVQARSPPTSLRHKQA